MEDRQRQSSDDEDIRSVEVDEQKNKWKELILMFETCPSLWNPRDRNYLNSLKKTEDLDKLVPIYKNIKPNATRDDTRKKINSLRSNYRKELKKIEISKRSGRGADEVYKPTSSTFYLLQFLEKIEKPKVIKDIDAYSGDESLVVSSITNESPVKTKKNSGALAKQNELLNRACSLLSEPSVPSQQDVNPLALVWSDKLHSLNPTQKLYAEKAIHDILFEAQINNLHRHSVQINASATHSSPAWSTPYPFTPSPVTQEPEYLIPDNCEAHTSPDTSTTYPPVLHKPDSNIPFVHATGSTFIHRKPIIISVPKRKRPSSASKSTKLSNGYKSTERTGFF